MYVNEEETTKKTKKKKQVREEENKECVVSQFQISFWKIGVVLIDLVRRYLVIWSYWC